MKIALYIRYSIYIFIQVCIVNVSLMYKELIIEIMQTKDYFIHIHRGRCRGYQTSTGESVFKYINAYVV